MKAFTACYQSMWERDECVEVWDATAGILDVLEERKLHGGTVIVGRDALEEVGGKALEAISRSKNGEKLTCRSASRMNISPYRYNSARYPLIVDPWQD